MARYKFVENRYQTMIKTIPKIWVVGDYDNTVFETPEKIQVINCKGTDLSNVWSVITRGPYGPFGLIAEEIKDEKFRGFFTLNPNVCRHVVKMISKMLKTKIIIQ